MRKYISSLCGKRESAMAPTKEMNEVVVSKCYECGSTMEGKLENYRYTECGLSSVVLKNVLVFRCKECGVSQAQICDAAALHRVLACMILMKETRLSGLELRFLRKVAGYSATDFAVVSGTSKSVMSRWEHRPALAKQTYRLVRLICAHKLLSDILCEAGMPDADRDRLLEQARESLTNMEETLKRIQAKKKGRRPVQYEIDPVMLSRYGTTDHASVAVLQ
jgi:YgiT-type zinc finger domain-containing protein